jgi:hypothetical protein
MLKTFSGWYYYCYKVAIAALVRVLDKVLSLLLQTATAALVAGQVDGVFCKSSL